MKRIIILITLIMGIIQMGAFAQEIKSDEKKGVLEDPNAVAAVTWENTIVNFGKIIKNNPSTAYFKFSNTGNKPVIITKAKGSCGCTGIKYPKEAIRPGETATIQATYNAATLGKFNKSVTVELNIEGSQKILRLKGEVVQKM